MLYVIHLSTFSDMSDNVLKEKVWMWVDFF